MITLDWGPIAIGAWQRMLGEVRSGVQQAWSYGEALRQSGVAVQRAAIRSPSGEELGCVQVADRTVLGPIGAGFLLRGPVWSNPTMGAAHYRAVLAGIRRPARPPDAGVGA